MHSLPASPGTYALILRKRIAPSVSIGRLGRMELAWDWYVYVGSALGPGGLQKRLLRHCRLSKRLHWHIDHLRAVTELVEVWYTVGETRWECRWSEAIRAMHGAKVPLAGFGASDCHCGTHLYALPTRPAHKRFEKELDRVGIGSSVVCRGAGELVSSAPVAVGGRTRFGRTRPSGAG